MTTRHLIKAALMVAALAAATPVLAQYSSLSLDLKFTLYASDEGRSMFQLPSRADLGVVFVKGTPDDAYTEANLAEMFQLTKVRTAGELGMDIRWPGEEIPNERIAHAFRLNGRDFLLMLTPANVDFRDQAYLFKADVYEITAENPAQPKRVCEQNVELNAFGLLGFYFKDKTFFLTVKMLKSGWGASVPRPPFFAAPGPAVIKKCA
jgi:hypothetical protein